MDEEYVQEHILSAPIFVIAGGLLGIEAAYGLAKTGASVTLVHLIDRLMERQLDARAALLLKRSNQLMRNHPQRGPRLRGARRRCVGFDATTPSEMAVSGHECVGEAPPTGATIPPVKICS
jgi:hypothetical protein